MEQLAKKNLSRRGKCSFCEILVWRSTREVLIIMLPHFILGSPFWFRMKGVQILNRYCDTFFPRYKYVSDAGGFFMLLQVPLRLLHAVIKAPFSKVSKKKLGAVIHGACVISLRLAHISFHLTLSFWVIPFNGILFVSISSCICMACTDWRCTVFPAYNRLSTGN